MCGEGEEKQRKEEWREEKIEEGEKMSISLGKYLIFF